MRCPTQLPQTGILDEMACTFIDGVSISGTGYKQMLIKIHCDAKIYYKYSTITGDNEEKFLYMQDE